MIRVGSITPKRKKDGSCVFLDANDRCSIHPVAPMGCAFFDMHMTKREGDARSSFVIQAQMTDAAYQKLRDEL